MPTESEMKTVVRAYIDGLNARDADAVLVLFADDAEMEDPIGTPVKSRAEIEAFFRGAAKVQPRLELDSPIRASHGNSAAMAFRVTTVRANGRFELSSIDVFHFDQAGKIRRLEGYWGPGDRRRVGDVD
jgi:steroid delta-isomerase